MQNFHRILTSKFTKWGNRILTKRHCSDAVPMSKELERKNSIFSEEQKRQLEEVGRIEKVAVTVSGPPENVTLMVNQNLSTPYDCCKHISLPLCHQSPLALLNDTILWDMHRPLPGECSLRFLSFRDREPFSLNEAFWRTGSFILGAVIMKSFKEDVGAILWNFPEVNLNSGSFIYDAVLKIPNWEVTQDELKILSGEFFTFVQQNHKIERLDVKKSIALEIFDENRSKQEEIKRVAAESQDNLITLYRVGDHIDVSTGPMVGDTSFFGRSTVTSVHSLKEYTDFPLYRFQGVALPRGILLNNFGYGIIIQRAEVLNEIPILGLKEISQPYGLPGTKVKNSDTKVPTIPCSNQI